MIRKGGLFSFKLCSVSHRVCLNNNTDFFFLNHCKIAITAVVIVFEDSLGYVLTL